MPPVKVLVVADGPEGLPSGVAYQGAIECLEEIDVDSVPENTSGGKEERYDHRGDYKMAQEQFFSIPEHDSLRFKV